MNAQSSINPFWGPPSSHSNFCEEDYMITRYTAEFINTLTNLIYVLYAIHGLVHLPRNPSPSLSRRIPYYGLIGVGICSAGFHMSLKYHTQMMDDLSMLLTTTPLLHRVLTVNADPRGSSLVAMALGSALVALAAVHVATDELILHAVSFVVSVTVIGVRTMQLLARRTVVGSAERRALWRMVVFGALIFNVGYAVWLVDGWVCEWLRGWRALVGLPWAFLLELHGWWHIFTGVGAYTFIAVIDHLVSGGAYEDFGESVAWPLSLMVRPGPEEKTGGEM
ncbi:ceramidase [Aspergillus homomorphus CBS 101889]|uniref:Alkaline ceramidase family protein n=1 Tax=Aspergillus homomorphus (strain CBS 101889) TaxID=1450537 RepID=A0A395HVD7_ASPHC|nr:alkaline ceramidase family protein [Aspergillus homomorphus CBS 101889]RAL10184.1 alkaline ceramidase family protein [Aspergillus homomorphus CBS 101889]